MFKFLVTQFGKPRLELLSLHLQCSFNIILTFLR